MTESRIKLLSVYGLLYPEIDFPAGCMAIVIKIENDFHLQIRIGDFRHPFVVAHNVSSWSCTCLKYNLAV